MVILIVPLVVAATVLLLAAFGEIITKDGNTARGVRTLFIVLALILFCGTFS